MQASDAVRSSRLMELCSGSPDVALGLIDGLIATDHPGHAGVIPRPDSTACAHGTPLVTATVAPLWSLFPNASAGQIWLAETQSDGARRHSVVPPLLEDWATHQALANRSY